MDLLKNTQMRVYGGGGVIVDQNTDDFESGKRSMAVASGSQNELILLIFTSKSASILTTLAEKNPIRRWLSPLLLVLLSQELVCIHIRLSVDAHGFQLIPDDEGAVFQEREILRVFLHSPDLLVALNRSPFVSKLLALIVAELPQRGSWGFLIVLLPPRISHGIVKLTKKKRRLLASPAGAHVLRTKRDGLEKRYQ